MVLLDLAHPQHFQVGLEKKLAAREPARARSGSRAWNEPSRASFLGSLKYRAEPSQLALAREPARELSHLWTTCQLSCNLKCFLFILPCCGYGTVKILIWYC